MRTVKSAADLKALALRTGGKATIGTKVFNASGERAAAPRREPAAPAPAKAAPQPAPVIVDTAPIAQAMTQQTDRMAALMASQIPARPGADPFAGWNVAVDYDSEGRITNVRATKLDT